MLKMLCEIAVRLAALDWPMDASSAVMVVPMLSPSRIGIAPARPITLVTPSAAGCEAKFCSTAIVADELCTTSVIAAPSSTPSAGISETRPIRSVNTALPASGFMTLPIISMPSNNRPNEKMTMPMFFAFSLLAIKYTRKPIKIIG